jgi:hypothetical protein
MNPPPLYIIIKMLAKLPLALATKVVVPMYDSVLS